MADENTNNNNGNGFPIRPNASANQLALDMLSRLLGHTRACKENMIRRHAEEMAKESEVEQQVLEMIAQYGFSLEEVEANGNGSNNSDFNEVDNNNEGNNTGVGGSDNVDVDDLAGDEEDVEVEENDVEEVEAQTVQRAGMPPIAYMSERQKDQFFNALDRVQALGESYREAVIENDNKTRSAIEDQSRAFHQAMDQNAKTLRRVTNLPITRLDLESSRLYILQDNYSAERSLLGLDYILNQVAASSALQSAYIGKGTILIYKPGPVKGF